MKIFKQNHSEIKAVVFDFDATLMDTEDYWYLADNRLLADYGINFTRKMKQKYIGKSLDDMVDDLFKIYNLKISKDEIKDKKNKYFLEASYGKVKMFPQMEKLYNKLKSLNIPMAIATGTEYDVVIKTLSYNNILNDFQFIVTAAEVKKGKPFPDIFLETSKRLKIKPENILVFEDSPYGVESALKSGAMCIAIPYLLNNKLDEVFYKADILVEKGMNGLNPEIVFKWIKS
jgi:HAD superfamily hydrolase (TIGR01509 family)